MVERMLADAEVAHGIRSVSLRYFNPAGSDPEGKRSLATITIHGTPFGNYIHLSDIAEAHARALVYLLAGENQGC